MPLTPETKRTDPTGRHFNSLALQDIMTMDVTQLKEYVRASFLQQQTPSLPNQFPPFHGLNRDMTAAQAMGRMLGTMYNSSRTVIEHSENQPIPQDIQEYPDKLEQVIAGIIDECVMSEGERTIEQEQLAVGVLEAVSTVRGRLMREREQAILKKGRKPTVQEMQEGLEYSPTQTHPLIRAAARLKNDPRYFAQR